MKYVKRRLTKAESDSLGIDFIPKDEHGNHQYTITKKQLKKLTKLRKATGCHGHCTEGDTPNTPLIKPLKTTPAKVLIFDIETSPSKGYFWGKWQQNIHDVMLTNEWFMLTWSAKWLFEDTVYNAKLTGKEAVAQDDKRITKAIWKMLDEADIVIGHNVKKFDVKKLNARFLLHGLGTPSSYEIIDTLLHARKSFAVHSNKLDYLAQLLKVGGKVKHDGFSMWDKCYKGDEDALAKMAEYNDGDIIINESVYLEIRPFIKPHPNMGLRISDDIDRCPTCDSDSLSLTGDYYTTTNSYPEYTCKSCGSNCRSRKANKRGAGIMSSLPR